MKIQELTQAKESQERVLELGSRIQEEIEQLEAQEAENENQEYLEKLRSLVSQNESYKKQEQDFKAKCKVNKLQLY